MQDTLSTCSVLDLLKTHSAVLDELKRRQVVRTGNNPTGDYTQWLVAQRLGLTLDGNSKKGYDAMDAAGMRYQTKGRRLSSDTASSQLGTIRDLNHHEFDFLVAVAFQSNWQVKCAIKVAHQTVVELADYRKHVNGHVLYVRPSLLEHATVVNVTEMLRA
ncbi:hypothetical protein [Ralstonia insidiosa]|uniref:Uncharacterized protein n=1 Tax=Ralstonia insidiosa TaxID=190721 RepID=A0A848P8K0_9RALS|nr:hypothetical protein [Ralstonia insidiosa]NMV41939.1 hypothetical protein [Ralstonia insidiosa]